MTSSLISRQASTKATEQNAKASPDFAAKLAETQALLQRAAAEFAPVTQASSLGAEDV
ncbi:MAG: phosphoadenylyl-sulfate reductase, partial [Limnohabitans sp.]